MKFEMIKGLEYTFYLVIKQDGSTTGLSLDPSDTARAMISTCGNNSEVAIDWVTMTQFDAENGKFVGVFTAEETGSLESYTGFCEDRCPSMPGYQAVFDTTTVAQGNKVYVIDGAYVKDIGL